MATVYLAIQESFQREVALKIMASSLSEDKSFSERFIQEARVVSRLVHPHIVTVYDVGIHEGHHYLSMEYVPGKELKHCLGELSGSDILRIVSEIASALDYASQKSCVHRDVKPENIMLHEESGRAVLMDFGIAKADDVGSGLTQTGMALGTPYYMSPEQARGHAVDGRADLYSLGIVFYKMLLGRVPFDGDSAVTIGIKHISEPVPRLPAKLAVFQPLLNKLLAKSVSDRYQRGAEVVAAIKELASAAKIIDKTRNQIFNAASGDSDLSLSDQANTVLLSGVDAEQAPRKIWPWLLLIAVPAALAIGYYVSFGRQFPPTAEQQLQLKQRLGLIEKPQLTLEDIMRVPAEKVVSAADVIAESAPQSLTDDTGLTSAPLMAERLEPLADPADFSDPEPLGGPGFTTTIDVIESSVSDDSAVGDDFEALLEDVALLEQQYASYEINLAELVAGYRKLLARQADYLPAKERLSVLKNEWLEIIDVSLEEAGVELEALANVDEQLQAALSSFPELAENPRYKRLSAQFSKQDTVSQALSTGDYYLSQGKYLGSGKNNAAYQYQLVLGLAANNSRAQQGMLAIAERFVEQAEKHRLNKAYPEAQLAIDKGLSLVPTYAPLLRIRQLVVEEAGQQAIINDLLLQAEVAEQQGQLIIEQNSAVEILAEVLRLAPGQPEAQEAMRRVVAKQLEYIEGLVVDKNLNKALAVTEESLLKLPANQQLLLLKQRINSLAPTIKQLSLSGAPLVGPVEGSSQQFKAARTLYIAFGYQNFTAATTVLQATLYDGDQTLQIAAVPVIVSGEHGEKIFKIQRPVEGFKAGGYRLDMLLDGEIIITQSFVIAP